MHVGLVLPMAKVEPTLCHMLKFAAEMGHGVSQQHTIDMTNELIKGTVIGAEVADWMLHCNVPTIERFNLTKIYSTEIVGWG